ncbi:amidohydrolase 2 [Thalassococcus profundi]|uniref:Amidohydrolase 2 n=1 Tax=Thalassococcus profundi TaxID=2282382 RepID=A0A369TMG1_9RHOB|nr:amidohydrolase family protein [Thalassococcus profundi]RDD65864.1 amidohydrolase 2 [Thalassococcus profundi]
MTAAPERTETPPVWVCHFHILDSAAPVAATATLPNHTASPAQYRQVARDFGLINGVIAQPSIYGTDNGVTLHALEQLGGHYRAIGVVSPDCDRAELERFHHLGMRGVRFNQVQAGATETRDIPRLAERIADLGWHIQLHIAADALEPRVPMLRALPVRVVLDHIGRCSHGSPGNVRTLIDLYESENTWVKLSGPYHERDPDGSWHHSLSVARTLVATDPSRLVWGSDWRHVTEVDKPRFDGLFRFVQEAAKDDAALSRIFSRNPAQLYA